MADPQKLMQALSDEFQVLQTGTYAIISIERGLFMTPLPQHINLLDVNN
jgi:hypothetical protein